MSRKQNHTTEATVRPKIREKIVEKVVEKVKEDLSIDSDFDLYGPIENARRNYFLALHVEQENPPIREQGILLKEVGAKAKKLQECISRLGYLEQARLGDWPDLDRLKHGLRLLERRAGKALDDLLSHEKQIRDALKKEKEKELDQSDDREDKPDTHRQVFIREMHAIYMEAMHEDRWTTPDLFCSFIKAFLPTINVEIKDSTLDRQIREALPQKNTQAIIGNVKKTDDPIANFISRPLSPKNTP